MTQHLALDLTPANALQAFIDDGSRKPGAKMVVVTNLLLSRAGFEESLLAGILGGGGVPQDAIGEAKE